MRTRTRNELCLILAIFVLAACKPPPAITVDPTPTRAVLDESYVLGPGDELKIVVFNHDDLSALCITEREAFEVRTEAKEAAGLGEDVSSADVPGGRASRCAVVGDSGSISFHLVGEIRAAGRTVEAVRRDYADRLADGFLVNPHISVIINKYRPFFIIGGVQEPGAYEYQADMTISKAIALAGGRNELTIKGAAPRLLRANGELVSRENITVDTTVFPGDFVEILWVPPLPEYDRKLKPGSYNFP